VSAYRRADLLELLAEAAELEHSLMCQYLFAAYSMKRTGLTDEQQLKTFEWERTVLLVARQEMEHLGLVINLTTAVGGAPTLSHPAFPYPTSLFGHQMALEPFSAATLEKFVCFERPEDVQPVDAFCMVPPISTQPYATVGELYERIRTMIITLAAETGDLFVGPPDAQVTGGQLGTDFPRIGSLGAGYDVFMRPVTDLPSALGAIDLVIEQGEGATVEHHEISHYRRFLTILHAVESDPFPAAERVLANPTPAAVTNPAARAVMELFDEAYGILLAILARLFSHTDETDDEVAILRSVAFMPLMTMAIRPLAETLTTMPAHQDDDGWRAGPAFDTHGAVLMLPHRSAAWTVLTEALQGLATRAASTAKITGMPARIAYVASSLDLIARRFAAGLGMGGSP
jgi:hypothetical protein